MYKALFINCYRIFERRAPRSGFNPLMKPDSNKKLHPAFSGIQDFLMKFQWLGKFYTFPYHEKQRNSVTGFTFMEILLAVGILGSVLCGILVTYSSCLVLGVTSKNLNISTNAALSLIEEIRSSTFSRIVEDYNGLNFSVNEIFFSRGVVYVNNTNPQLLEVTISICWRQGNRVIGEDTNLNGVLDAGEDTNLNGIIDSPAEFITRVANR